MKSSVFLLFVCTVFLWVQCAPPVDPALLYSSRDLSFVENFGVNGKQPSGLTHNSLKMLFDSAGCDRFEDRVWSHIHQILFESPTSPSVFQKTVKSFAGKYFLETTGNPRAARDFSNYFSNMYSMALEFFSDKTQEQVLQEWEEVEKVRSGPHILSSQQLAYFLSDMQTEFQKLKQLAGSIGLRCLTEHLPVTHTITFHSGMNMFEMAQLLESRKLIRKEDFLSLCQNPNTAFQFLGQRLESVEGYLHPDTYSYAEGDSPLVLIRSMIEKFLQAYKSLNAAQSSSLSRHHIVTLASIVEKEALLNEEKPVISSVFHNRLDIGMRLQSDPTVSYGILRETGVRPKKMKRADFKRTTSYNTYRLNSFPQGPISNPDRNSLHSVIHPAQTPYYYFVSVNGRTHVFSTRYEDHKRAARRR